jgi:hypothetical protein
MPPPDRTDQLLQVPLTHLVSDLLRQFNKPTLLGKHGMELSKADMDNIAECVEKRESLPDSVATINDALVEIVQESVDELQQRFGLTFAESLATTDLSEIGGWETTAEFLEIANHKNNAELRISAGTSLMVFLGDTRPAEHLFTVIHNDNGLDDVDAMIAKRALSYHTRIALDVDDWEQQVKAALQIE